MARMSRHALREAEKRDLVPEGTADDIKPKRNWRVCPACGEEFRPLGEYYKGFCCGHCAFAWGEAAYQKTIDRTLANGVEVVVYESGMMGVITRVANAEEIYVLVDNELEMFTSKEVERIQYMIVDHGGGRCSRGRAMRRAVADAEKLIQPVDPEAETETEGASV